MRFFSYATILISTVVFGCLVFLAPRELTEPSGFWAFFFYDEYTPLSRWVFVLAPLSVLLTYRLRTRSFSSFKRILPESRVENYLLIVLLFAVSFCVFWFFREQRHWGDARQLMAVFEGRSHHVKPLGIHFWRHPFDTLITFSSYTVFHRFLGWQAEDSIALINCLAGSGFVILLLVLARLLGQTTYDRFFIFSFTFSMGASQIFFGHVEQYTLVSVAILLCILYAIRFLKGEKPLYLVYLFAAVAVSTHLLASFLLPSIAALPFLQSRRPIRNGLKAAIPGILYFVLFYLFCRFVRGGAEPHFTLNFPQAPQPFLRIPEVFTSTHLWNVLQNYLLSAPLGICILAVETSVDKRTAPKPDRIALFLWITALSFLVYVLFFRTVLNRLMDWDVLSPAAVPAALLAAYTHISPHRARGPNRILGLFALLVSLSFTVPWIASNHIYQQLPFPPGFKPWRVIP
jgi:hypothetical protein